MTTLYELNLWVGLYMSWNFIGVLALQGNYEWIASGAKPLSSARGFDGFLSNSPRALRTALLLLQLKDANVVHLHRGGQGRVVGAVHATPKNITELTNPLNNSINEKCTRIKEAFLLLMHEDLACNYYIDGPRSERKRIKLPRHLVEWEGGDA